MQKKKKNDDDAVNFVLAAMRRGRGWYEVKRIHGRRYVYWRWREGRHKRSMYLGLADDFRR